MTAVKNEVFIGLLQEIFYFVGREPTFDGIPYSREKGHACSITKKGKKVR